MEKDKPVSAYINEVSKITPLSKDEELDLWRRAKSMDENQSELAKRRLIESRLHLVLSIAERYSTCGIPMLELIQEGNVGLMYALDRFEPIPEHDFSAQAAVLIERAIVSAIAQEDSQ